MSREDQHVERKSLRVVAGATADWHDLARCCVCFANGDGGRVLVGIEDGDDEAPAGQPLPHGLLDRLVKRIGELTVNVQVFPTARRAPNGGEFVELTVPRSTHVASTSDGRYFIRVADSCVPVLGDDVARLSADRPGHPWETLDSSVQASAADVGKVERFVAGIRASGRVKPAVKEKDADELLVHYGLVNGRTLTNLGVMLVGATADRRGLGTAPIVQALKFDAQGQKVNKWVWDDYTSSPVELLDEVWDEVPDFRETYEVSEGLYRRQVPAYDESVVRELLVNALVHRPYTQRGDIFLNLHPDRLEVVNPGRLPIGVTPGNILHMTRRRNEGLARVFHDLELMEREGTGFDLMYDRLLSQGRPAPVATEGPDSVSVTIQRRILRPELMRLIADADARFQLSQRERITLGVLGQGEGLTARHLAEALQVESGSLKSWLGRLTKFGLVHTSGRAAGTRYFVAPAVLKDSGVSIATSLARIEPHRLHALIREDLDRYPGSTIGEVHVRIGQEVARTRVKRALATLVEKKEVELTGMRKAARYWPRTES